MGPILSLPLPLLLLIRNLQLVLLLGISRILLLCLGKLGFLVPLGKQSTCYKKPPVPSFRAIGFARASGGLRGGLLMSG